MREFSLGTFCTITFKRPNFTAETGTVAESQLLTDPVTGQVAPEVEAQVEAQVEIAILRVCEEAPQSSAEIASALGHKQLSGNLRKALPHLREACLLEYTIPDKPMSRLQQYRITETGRAVLARLNGGKAT